MGCLELLSFAQANCQEWLLVFVSLSNERDKQEKWRILTQATELYIEPAPKEEEQVSQNASDKD